MRYLLLIQMLLLTSIAFGQGNIEKGGLQQKEKARQTQTTPDENKKSTQQPPVSVTVNPTVTTSKEPSEETETTEKKSSPWEMVTGISTASLAIITFTLAFFTYSLWKATGKLVSDAEKTSKRELRAYIGMGGGGEVFLLPNKILRGVVEIKNFGETPAHNVMVALAGELRAPGDKRPFNDPVFIPHKQPIAPTMSWTFGHEFQGMTDQDLKDVLADRKLVYIWGHVKYQDIYKETQTLRFRLRNVVKILVTTKTGTTIEKWKFYPEDEGNDAS